jgi:cysteine synthase A
MIIEGPLDFVPMNVLVRLRTMTRVDVSFYLKSEMFNPAGSIKFKPAVAMVRELKAQGRLQRGGGIIDTTSGNMGIALAIAARALGCRFVCVCDEKITLHNRALLDAYGAELVILTGSTLKERYAYIERRVAETPSLVWTRQFRNPENPLAHESTTAVELLSELPDLTHLFVGAGTAGTLSGCAQALRRHSRRVRLVAVDAVGSHHFPQPPALRKRLLPGIGATERSSFLESVDLHDVAIVPEAEAIDACRALAQRTGWLFGASTGSVLAAMKRFEHRFDPGDVVVGIAADSGERYLDCVYSQSWVERHFPELRPEEEAWACSSEVNTEVVNDERQ